MCIRDRLLGRIVAHLLLTVIDCCSLYDDGQVPARTDRQGMADYLIAQEFCVLLGQAQAVVFLILIPVFQLNDHVDGLRLLDALHTEPVSYTHLHMDTSGLP